MNGASGETKRVRPTHWRWNIVAERPLAATLLVLLAVTLATRAWVFGNPVYHVDEQYYLLVGDRMLHGAVPYVDLWDRKPIGLFLLFAGLRLLPGDGVIAAQLVAMVFAGATAGWSRSARRLGAGGVAATGAGAAYLIWLPLLSGAAGQSPVFYNLFMTAGGVLVLRLPALAARGARRAIVASGAAACLLAGLAIQTNTRRWSRARSLAWRISSSASRGRVPGAR